ncbi:MAG: hypothetical protein NTY12_05405 [Candidatus Falkowbacteria bacterium]|nr:hypothetical protein [Candidatus Falkowbacteria bacterium]
MKNLIVILFCFIALSSAFSQKQCSELLGKQLTLLQSNNSYNAYDVSILPDNNRKGQKIIYYREDVLGSIFSEDIVWVGIDSSASRQFIVIENFKVIALSYKDISNANFIKEFKLPGTRFSSQGSQIISFFKESDSSYRIITNSSDSLVSQRIKF